MTTLARVTDAPSLRAAVVHGARVISVERSILGLQSLRLAAGVRLQGGAAGVELRFEEGRPGLMLSADNEVASLRLVTDPTQIALGLADEAEDLGTITISEVTTIGRVHLAGVRAKRADLRLRDIHVEAADARLAARRPAGFGVEVLLGCISIHNASRDPASQWSLEARGLSGGSRGRPLRGGGVFVFGGWSIPVDADMSAAPSPSRRGGEIDLRRLTTGEIYVDGGIPKGAGDLIAGGVFIGSGVRALEVVNEGAVTTYGPNDMVLDNWGAVGAWVSQAPITSHGASGIGFVNFGDLQRLDVQAPIETFGIGARGFNLYDGSLGNAAFRSLATRGDGAVGMQVSKPFGSIVVAGDVRTSGGEGDSLVKGKVVHLKAHAVSPKPGAKGETISIGGAVVAEHAGIAAWEFEAPAQSVAKIEVGGEPLN